MEFQCETALIITFLIEETAISAMDRPSTKSKAGHIETTSYRPFLILRCRLGKPERRESTQKSHEADKEL